MSDFPIIILYGPNGRNLTALRQACSGKDINLPLHVVNNPSELHKVFQKNSVAYIVVSFTSDDIGERSVREFVESAFRILQPEDADIKIIYTTEGETPRGWSWPNLDPRPIKNYDENPCLINYNDVDWNFTIQQLKDAKSRFSYERNTRTSNLKIEINGPSSVPFPSEAIYLMRAAFKDMSRLQIEFPDQGLSGSIACFVSPTDAAGKKCKEMFVKIFNKHNKAHEELANTLKFIEPYIDYPKYHHYRRYQGVGYSLMVTDCTKGPRGHAMTFSKMIQSHKISVKAIEGFAGELVALLDKLPTKEESTDMVNVYLSDYLNQDDKKLKLESDNGCHQWFGGFSDSLSLEEKIRRSFGSLRLRTEVSGICHGDLHSDNILVKVEGHKELPELIDFSRAGWTHAIKDIVTVEIDMIIRGLSEIKAFEEKGLLLSFLKALKAKGGAAVLFNKKHLKGKKEFRRGEKVRIVIQTLRRYAFKKYKIDEIEYSLASVLKTLEVLSYGKLPFRQNERATAYVSFLVDHLKSRAK